jgi:hypothetical protein
LRGQLLELLAEDLHAAFRKDAGQAVQVLADGSGVSEQPVERDQSCQTWEYG